MNLPFSLSHNSLSLDVIFSSPGSRIGRKAIFYKYFNLESRGWQKTHPKWSQNFIPKKLLWNPVNLPGILFKHSAWAGVAPLILEDVLKQGHPNFWGERPSDNSLHVINVTRNFRRHARTVDKALVTLMVIWCNTYLTGVLACSRSLCHYYYYYSLLNNCSLYH